MQNSCETDSQVIDLDKKVLSEQDIVKNYKTLSGEQIELAMSTPSLAASLLSVVSKLSDNQLKHAIPRMTADQIKSTIPKLQLQQTGVCVQVMSPNQIRTAISALTSDDRSLLMGNISLLTSCSSKDELQSFIAFVDPLAMCIAVQISQLSKKLIECAAVMTKEQIRIIVPLLNSEQIRDLLIILEEDTLVEIAIQMIDRKDELIRVVQEDLPKLEKKYEDLCVKFAATTPVFPDLSSLIKNLPMVEDKEQAYYYIVRRLKNVKIEVENLQQGFREINSSLIMPSKILSEREHGHLFEKFVALQTGSKRLAKETHRNFSLLDQMIADLNQHWLRIQPTLSRVDKPSPVAEPESIFENDDRAILLYEAVKRIGNPDAVGNDPYPMTWNDIVQAGFACADDFAGRGITSLEQLQKHIDNLRKLST